MTIDRLLYRCTAYNHVVDLAMCRNRAADPVMRQYFPVCRRCAVSARRRGHRRQNYARLPAGVSLEDLR